MESTLRISQRSRRADGDGQGRFARRGRADNRQDAGFACHLYSHPPVLQRSLRLVEIIGYRNLKIFKE